MMLLSAAICALLLAVVSYADGGISRIAMIKQEKAKILRGLKMKERPPAIEETALRWARDVEEESFEGATFTQTYLPRDDWNVCYPVDGEPTSNCFSFTLQKNGTVVGADIVLNFRPDIMKKNITVSFYDLDVDGSGVGDSDVTQLRVDLQMETQKWLKRSSRSAMERFIKIDARIAGREVAFDGLFATAPQYEVVYGKVGDRVGITCDVATSCCLIPFYVNFTEIGWTDWIHSPAGYYANYCAGICSLSGNDDLNRVLRTTRSQTAPHLFPSPQCAPTYFAPLTIMYAAGPRDLRRVTLHGMKALECGCLAG